MSRTDHRARKGKSKDAPNKNTRPIREYGDREEERFHDRTRNNDARR